MTQPTEKLLADYAAGKLSPAEQRRLAQAALDDDALFDALTVHAAMEQGLRENPELRAAVAEQKVALFPWKRVAVGAIAAGIALFAVYWLRTPAPAGLPGPPVLLARDLARPDAPVFRGEAGDSRLPRNIGSVASVDDDVVTADLGAVDGIAKGTELTVTRGERAVGRLAVTTVFRERSRARVADGAAVQARDQVHVPDAIHRAAVLEQAQGLAARGQAAQALELLRKTPAAADATLANDLGAYFLRRGDLVRAQAALHLAGSGARASNNLGALYEAHGERRKAAGYYQEALRLSPSAEDRQAIAGNLARLKQAR